MVKGRFQALASSPRKLPPVMTLMQLLYNSSHVKMLETMYTQATSGLDSVIVFGPETPLLGNQVQVTRSL